MGDNSCIFNPENTYDETMQKLSKYLNVVQTCLYMDRTCEDLTYKFKWSDEKPVETMAITSRIMLSDGTVLGIQQNDKFCEGWRDKTSGEGQYWSNDCGYIFVDVNGSAPPNVRNKDLFIIEVERKRTTPYHIAFGDYDLKDYLTNKI